MFDGCVRTVLCLLWLTPPIVFVVVLCSILVNEMIKLENKGHCLSPIFNLIIRQHQTQTAPINTKHSQLPGLTSQSLLYQKK